MKYWQVAAGEGGRDYSEDFLNFGVMFIGNLPKVGQLHIMQIL